MVEVSIRLTSPSRYGTILAHAWGEQDMLESVRPVSIGHYNRRFQKWPSGSGRGYPQGIYNRRRQSDGFFLSFPELHLLNLLERKVISKYRSLFEGTVFGFKVDIYA